MEIINKIPEDDEFSCWNDVYYDFLKNVFEKYVPDAKLVEVDGTEVLDRIFVHVDGNTEYIVRMWNLSERGIAYSLYKRKSDDVEEMGDDYYKIQSDCDFSDDEDYFEIEMDDDESDYEFTDNRWTRFKNFAVLGKGFFNDIKLIDDAFNIDWTDENLKTDTIYFDGGEYDDFTADDIVLFKKDHSYVTLTWCLENPEFNDFMTDEELREWAEESPWENTKGTVNEIISRMILYDHYGCDDDFEMNFKIQGEASTEDLEELFFVLGNALMSWRDIFLDLENVTGCKEIVFNKNCARADFGKEMDGFHIKLPPTIEKIQPGIFSRAFSLKCDSPEFYIQDNVLMDKDRTTVITSWKPEE